MDDSNNNSESSPNLEEAAQESSDPPPAEENKSNDETSSEQSPPTEADKPESQENKDANVVTEPSSITEAATTPNNNQDNATSPAPSEKDKEDANKTPAALVKDSDKSDTVAVSATLEDVKNAGENSLSGLAKSVENEKSSFLSFLTGMNASQKSNATDEDDDETNAHNVAGFLDEESAPLLPRPAATARRFLDRIWLILFLALVVGGVSIGAFLLIWLGKSEYQSTHFVLMNKSDWAIYQPVRPMKKLNLPIKNVALIQINAFDSKYCNQDTFYANCVQQIQKKNIFKMLQADILYNFVVDEAGTIYEGRGWNNCTCTENYTDKDLTIGILINHDGTVTNSVPTYIQNFIDDAITKAMVDPCFNMSIHNGTAISMIKEHVKINNNLC